MGSLERLGALIIVGVVGLVLLAVGIAQVYPPGAWIAVGVALCGVAWAGARPYLRGSVK
ncbi:MAG: hypothetical protein Q7R41_08295 [Phycisphaerales bacterium]|nr:hypothetical protein [Phycisphaerales bacterium]